MTYQAARVQAAVESLRQSLALPTTESGVSEYQALLLRTDADPTQFAESWAEGLALSLDEAIAYALTEEAAAKVAKLAASGYNYAIAAHHRAATLCNPLF
jgi:hypothetical protein